MAAKYTDTITTDAGTVLEGATVELLTGAGALVTTYTDDALTQNAATSRTADANGLIELYVADGTYSVRTTYNGVVKMLANVELYDISTIASTSSGAVANKAQASAVGISGSAENMGAYTSPSLTDNQTAKQNIEELGAAADARPTSATLAATGGAALIGTANFSGVTIPDGSNGQQALQALETAVETKAPAAFSHATSYSAGTIGARLKNAVYVTDAPYNCVGDGGLTDNTSGIQAALDSGARVVIVPKASSYFKVTDVLLQTTPYQQLIFEGDVKLVAPSSIRPILIVTQAAVGSYRGGSGTLDHDGTQWPSGTGFKSGLLGGGGGDARGVAVLVMADNAHDENYNITNGWDCNFSWGNFDLVTGAQSAGPSHPKVNNMHTYNGGCGQHTWGPAPSGYYFQGVGINSLTATNFEVDNCTDYGSRGGFWADTNGGSKGCFSNCIAMFTAVSPIWSDAAAGSNQMWYTDGVFGGTITGAGDGWKKTPGGVAFMSGSYGVSFVNCQAIEPQLIGLALDQNSSGNQVTNFRVVRSGAAGIIDAGLKNKFTNIILEDCCRSTGTTAASGSVCPTFAPFEAMGQSGGNVEPQINGLVIKGGQAYPGSPPPASVYLYGVYARRSSSLVASKISITNADVINGATGNVLTDTSCEVGIISGNGLAFEIDTYGGDPSLSIKRAGSSALKLSKNSSGDAIIENLDSAKNIIIGQTGGGTIQMWSNGTKKVQVEGTNIYLLGLPTSAPGASGGLWRDAAAGNVVKVVP